MMNSNPIKTMMDFKTWNTGFRKFVAHFSPSTKKEWTTDLGRAVDQLTQLNASTETEFLSLGESLQDYYLRTRKISQDSSAIAGRMSGQEITAAIEGLREIFNRIEDLDNKSRQGVEILSSILNMAGEIGTQLDYFSRVVKNLYVLSNFIKIETARIKGSDKEFAALVEDIKQLAGNIESKSKVLYEQTRSLSILTRKNLTIISDFETRQQGQSRKILDGSMKNLHSLSERNELSAVTVNNLSSQWDHISRSIGEVVAALQFHDITRQQIEHAMEALNGLACRESAPDHSNRLPAIIGKRRLGPSGPEDPQASSLQERAGLTVATCKLQMAQLRYAADDLVSAVNRVKTHLRTISGQAGEMSQEAKGVTGIKGKNGSSFLEEMERDLSALTGSLGDYAKLNREMEKTMGQVAEMVAGMSSFVNEIEKIGIDMKMVALNAIIHAAHIGDEGLPLGVLAESVHHLSVETTDQINTIADHLKTVITTSDQLAKNVQSDAERKWKGGDYLAGFIRGMIEPLQQLDEDMAALLARIDESGKTFQDDIEQTIQKITVHDRVGQGIETVNSGLESLVGHITQAVPAVLEYEPSQELKELTQRYTMDREREIHQSLLLSASPARILTEAGVELGAGEILAGTEPPEEGQEKKDGGEDFGDNVDLF
jgi:methyl-accepting chemotaxis protein